MYDVEKFIKSNIHDIKRNSSSNEVANQVMEELRQVQVWLESDFITEAKKIFIKYNVKPFTMVVTGFYNFDPEQFDYWLHHSDS